MASTLVTPLYVIYEAQFHFSRITLTLIYATYIVGNMIALMLLGRLSDAIGRRVVCLAATGIAVLSALLFLFASSAGWLFAARAVSGLSVGLAAGATTAWITELDVRQSRARASLIVTASNFLGLALGSLLSGALARYAPFPLEIPYIIFLGILLALGLLLILVGETVRETKPLASVDWTPRLALPPETSADFVAPAITAFGAMALVGYYAALIPSILAETFHQTDHLVAGAIVSVLTVTVAITIVLTRHVGSQSAMLAGLALMVPSVGLIAVAELFHAMPALLAGTIVGGVSAALGYRGSLQVVNEIAPPDRRAEVVSLYFLAGFAGNGLPVIGVGILATVWNPSAAGLLFAACIGAFSILALVIAARRLPVRAVRKT